MPREVARSLSGRHWRAFAEISCELAETSAHDVDGGLRRLLDWICDTTHARAAWVVFVVREETRPEVVARDALRGWRPRRTIYHREPPEGILLREAYWADPPTPPDPTMLAIARTMGRHRAFLHREIVDGATWRRCPQATELWRPLNIHDRLMSGAAVAPSVELIFGVERATCDRRFGELERDLMGMVVERLAWFHRRLAWSHGMSGAGGTFTPRERVILTQLLSARSEKQIAAQLKLTERSTHQYVVGVYRKLGVTSRAELMARFLRGDRAPAANASASLPWFPAPGFESWIDQDPPQSRTRTRDAADGEAGRASQRRRQLDGREV
jgi:DNA-binding CsgD family transcriptional regulator